MVKTIEYLSLSALAYVDFKESDAGLTLDEIIRDEQKKKSRKDFNINNPELSALKNESNPLRSYILLDYISTPPSGFCGAAFQNPKTGEIIFSFKGTDFDLSGIKGYIEADNDISNADTQIALGM